MLKVTEYNDVIRIDLARTIAGRGRYWTTAYYVDGFLVDTGCAHTAVELTRFLKDQPLHCIINTHSHEDHIGANGSLQHQHQVEILAHPRGLPILADPYGKQPLQPYRRLFWGWPEPSSAKAISNHEVVETGRYKLQAIYTPGHSPDHLCLYEVQAGWIFTGDLFVGGKDRALRADYDIWQIINSLKQISRLKTTFLFPGSARVREDSETALQERISYLEDLGGRVLDLHEKGWSTRAIARALLGGPMWVERVTLGHFSRQQLVHSYLRSKDDTQGENLQT
jgi:glyoxylase-like metal-dependent hydrolase (beta-lactamase superfamily II)